MLQREHSAILSTFINLPFVIKIFDFSIFEVAVLHSFDCNGTYCPNIFFRGTCINGLTETGTLNLFDTSDLDIFLFAFQLKATHLLL